uniref:Uncharacterized protein n=1 Tax=Rhizophora mucronata TaxID=61149 RepID=A0A2P2PT73_RHIMU
MSLLGDRDFWLTIFHTQKQSPVQLFPKLR